MRSMKASIISCTTTPRYQRENMNVLENRVGTSGRGRGRFSPRAGHRDAKTSTSRVGVFRHLKERREVVIPLVPWRNVRTSTRVGASPPSSIQSESEANPTMPKARAKDLQRYESLFHKYSTFYKQQEMITLAEFQQLMYDMERPSKQRWDEAFVEGCSQYRPAELPQKTLQLLYDRLIAGKAKKYSGRGILLSSLGIFAGFCALCYVSKYMVASSYFSRFHDLGAPFFLGSFGTLSILVFGQASSINIRIWNVVMGHLIGASCGLLCAKLFGYSTLAKAAAMTSTLAAMLWTGAVHPPGGAIALLAVSDIRLQHFQHWYILYPALFGAFILYVVGFLTNRLKETFSSSK